MAKIIEITNPLTGLPQQVIQSAYTAQQIDNAVANMGAASTPQAALAALGAGVPLNLLDNPYFSSLNAPGLPINQNAATNWSGDYSLTIDRWRKANIGTVSISEAGIYVPVGEIQYQYINPNFLNYLFGKTVTASVFLADGRLFTGTGEFKNQAEINPLLQDTDVNIYTLNSGGFQVAFANNSFVSTSPQTYVAAKLEVGDKQTLAYQDSDGNWQLLPQPDMDYLTQLQKCYPYIVNYNQFAHIPGAMYSATQGIFTIPIPTTMRTLPVVSQVYNSGIYCCDGSIIPSGAITFVPIRVGPGICVIRAELTQSATIGPAVISDFSALLDASL